MLVWMNIETNRPFDAATTVEHSSNGNDTRRPLAIDNALFDRILEHLRSWLPNEGCGLLASVADGEVDRAVHFFLGTNIDYSPVRYTMDPTEVIAAIKQIRTESWNLAAIVHSHPRTKPELSRTDLREWYYPEARALIVSFANDEPEIGCWQPENASEPSGFRPAPLVIIGR